MSYIQGVNESIQTGIHPISVDYTILDNDGYGFITSNFTSTSKMTTITLPQLSNNSGRIIYIKNIATGITKIEPNGSELIEGSTYKKIFSENDIITLIGGETEWNIINYKVSMNSGFFYNTTSANRQIGFVSFNTTNYIDYSNIGKHLSDTDGNSAIIFNMASTSLIFLYNVNSTFGLINLSTAKLLTINNSTYTIYPSSESINQNSYIPHDLNRNLNELNLKLFLGTTGYNNDSQDITGVTMYLSASYGSQPEEIDSNNCFFRTVNGGLVYNNGTNWAILSDHFLNLRLEYKV